MSYRLLSDLEKEKLGYAGDFLQKMGGRGKPVDIEFGAYWVNGRYRGEGIADPHQDRLNEGEIKFITGEYIPITSITQVVNFLI